MAPRYPPSCAWRLRSELTRDAGYRLVAFMVLVLCVFVVKWWCTTLANQGTIDLGRDPLQHICTDCEPTFKGLTLSSAFTGGRILTSTGHRIIESDNDDVH